MEDPKADLSRLMIDFEQILESFGHDVEEQVFEAASMHVSPSSQGSNARPNEQYSTPVEIGSKDAMDSAVHKTKQKRGTSDESGETRDTINKQDLEQSDSGRNCESTFPQAATGTESDNVVAQSARQSHSERRYEVGTTGQNNSNARESNAGAPGNSRSLVHIRDTSPRDLTNGRPAATAHILEEYFHRLHELRLDAQSQSLMRFNDFGDDKDARLATADTAEHKSAQVPMHEASSATTASVTVRVRMTRAKAQQVRQRMISQLKRQGVGTRSFAKFKHEICHRAGLVVHFASFYNNADSLPDVLTQMQCKTAIARLTGLGGEDLLIACTMLDPSGSGLVSIDSIIDFMTDEFFVDTWFYVHNAGRGNVFNQQVRVVPAAPTPAPSRRQASSSSSPPPSSASSTPAAIAVSTGFVGSRIPGVAGPRQSSIVSTNGNGFGPLSISRRSPLGQSVPPWNKAPLPKASVNSPRIARIAGNWQTPMQDTPRRHESQHLDRDTHAARRSMSFMSQNGGQRNKPTESVAPGGEELTLEALAAVGSSSDGFTPKHHTPQSRDQSASNEGASRRKVPSNEEQESAPAGTTDNDVLAATRRYMAADDLDTIQRLTSVHHAQMRSYADLLSSLDNLGE